MHHFRYRGDVLYCEAIPAREAAEAYGTPLFLYSQQTIIHHFQRLARAVSSLDHLICYAIKANSNLAIIATLGNLGSGYDIVSEGELRRVRAAGGDPRACIFAGVGKSEGEIEFALRQGIYAFNIESEGELERIRQVARRIKRPAPVAFRINPNVAAGTHAKITTGTYENKFGIPLEEVDRLYARAGRSKEILVKGVQMHIGSQLTEINPFRDAVQRAVPVVKRLQALHPLEFFSIGGGLGIVYNPALASGSPEWWRSEEGQAVLTPETYAAELVPLLRGLGLRILLEPGRFLVGNAGILVTRVEYVKRTARKNFIIVDAAMNDLIRPAFYDSYHEIVPLRRTRRRTIPSDVVGPVCESSDVFCKERPLAEVREGEYLAFLSAGAYGSVMGSNYNSRPLAAEAMVRGDQSALIRKRQPLEAIWELEKIPAWVAEANGGSRRPTTRVVG